MGSLAIPVLEKAGEVLLYIATAGAGAKTADEVAKRQKTADDAKDKPIAQAQSQAKAREKCKKCPPDGGTPFVRNTAGWSSDSIAYQLRIAQMPPAAPGFLTEWTYNAVTFDGFASQQCLLKEAKGRYDQFFNDFRQVEPWWRGGEEKLVEEAMRQGAAAVPRPPVHLTWFFMEPISYRYFSKIINAAYPDIEVRFEP